ncbi:AAA family ATPase, partial [Cobetia sp. SIMBA_158]|uniref:ParA family protein n=1 Tax=Cobetia sp. SIMBA_158 TaxID=3081617 RepID=UPI003980252D
VLASQGKKVLIVDADNQSNVALTFGKNPDEFAYGLYDVLIDGIPAEHTIVNVHENIDIIPATDDLVGFDFEVIGNSKKYPRPFELMYKGINHLRSQYDFILIDTPTS